MSDNNADAMQRRAQMLRAQSLALTVRAIQLGVGARLAIASVERSRLASDVTLTRLRRSVTSYAEMLRTLGEPTHRAIDGVRRIADEAQRAVARPIRGAEGEALVNQMVLWTVDAYAA